MFKRILVPLDGSERAEQSLPVAARIARGSGGAIILVQVIDIQIAAYAYATHQPLIASHLEASGNEARSYLTELTTSSMFEGVPTEIHVPYGSVPSQILSVADTSQADSMVLTSHGYTGVTRWVLGSVAEYIVRHGSVPVLLVREGHASRPDLSPEADRPVRVLVPLDGSFLAKTALAPAACLVSALVPPARGTLHLMRVVKPAKAREAQQSRVRRAERYLRVIAAQMRKEPRTGSEAPDLTITWSVVVHQDAAEGIISEATGGEQAGRDTASGGWHVIAMATNGRSGLRRWIIGSVTEGVLTKTELPLLIVRPSEEDRKHRVPTEAHERTFPLMRPGAVYPKHYLMAVIDNVKEAEEAVQSLQNMGIPPEDIRLFEGHEVIEYAEHTERTRSLGSRLADVLQAVTSDEDTHILIYVEEALRGHTLLNVYVPKPEQVEQVKDILAAHHARTIKYFGRWAITVLHH